MHRPALRSRAGTHTLGPSIFLCYSSCGPQHGKREAPGNIPSPSDVAHSVRARRKPVAAQGDGRINPNPALLARGCCAGHPGGMRPWEPACPRSKATPKAVLSRCPPCPSLSPKASPACSQPSTGPGAWPCLAAAAAAGVCPSCVRGRVRRRKTSWFALVRGVSGVSSRGRCDLAARAMPSKGEQQADPEPRVRDMAKT